MSRGQWLSLAVYILGLVVGNMQMAYSKTIAGFDGIRWLAQLIMFLALGLLVDLDNLIAVALPATIISLFVLFFGRPISVHLTLLPF